MAEDINSLQERVKSMKTDAEIYAEIIYLLQIIADNTRVK